MLKVGKHEQVIKKLWDSLSSYPGGRTAFSKIVGRIAPYSGSIGAMVMDLGPGRARLQLRERWRLKNPFDSIHAVALANLAELTSGLALMYELPPGIRAIIVKLEIEFVKKARGLIVATCQADPIQWHEEGPVHLVTNLHDEAGELVARMKATWLISVHDQQS